MEETRKIIGLVICYNCDYWCPQEDEHSKYGTCQEINDAKTGNTDDFSFTMNPRGEAYLDTGENNVADLVTSFNFGCLKLVQREITKKECERALRWIEDLENDIFTEDVKNIIEEAWAR
jgi:hypothetical protein